MSGPSSIQKNADGTTILSLSDLKGKNSNKYATQKAGTLTDQSYTSVASNERTATNRNQKFVQLDSIRKRNPNLQSVQNQQPKY